jgi:hypothetical protein
VSDDSYRAAGRRQPMDFPGSVERPFDRDPAAEAGGGMAGLHSDAACTIPWLADGFQAVQVFVDPGLVDRAEEICGTLEGVATAHRDIDTLSGAIQTWARGEGLSASMFENPPDELSAGVVAVAVTLG